MKVSELTDEKLDYWVAKAEGKEVLIAGGMAQTLHRVEQGAECYQVYSPSTDWSQGGPIIEREGITIEPNPYGLKLWAACSGPGPRDTEPFWIWKDGETPLIAAMRTYVTSKFGEEVDDSQTGE